METRKVQLTGGSTYIISLPKAWVKKVNVQVGDSVNVLPRRDGNLLLIPHPTRKKKAKLKIVNIDEEESEHLLRRLIGVYLAGHDHVELRTKDRMTPRTRQIMRELIKKVIGPEIIDETTNSVTIQDLVDPSDLPLPKSVRRMYLISKAMFEDAISAVVEGDTELARDVIMRDDEVDRLYWLILKQYNMILADMKLSEKVGMNSSEALAFLLVARIIERIADHSAKIAGKVVLIEGKKLNKKLLERLEKSAELSLEVVNTGIESLFEKNLQSANEAIDMVRRLDDINDKIMGNILKLEGASAVALASILESVERIGYYGSDISEEAINYTAQFEGDAGN